MVLSRKEIEREVSDLRADLDCVSIAISWLEAMIETRRRVLGAIPREDWPAIA